MQQYFLEEKKMKKLFAFVLDCNHHLICLVNQIRGRGEDRRRSGKKGKKSSKNAKYLDDLDRLKICLTLYYIKKNQVGFVLKTVSYFSTLN